MEQITINVPSMEGIDTKENFIDTGRIIRRAIFENQFPEERLHVNTTDVVVYAGGKYIQMIKPKGFMIDNQVYVKLDLAEDVLWEIIS